MNKNILILLALGAIGLTYYFATSSNSAMMPKEEMMAASPSPVSTDAAMMKDEKMMEAPSDSNMMKKSTQYLMYEDGVLEANSTARRILFFYASWCPNCRPVDAELTKRVAELPEGVVVIRVNYNDPETDAAEKALASKYGVTYQHTFVEIDGSGEKVQTWNGGSVDMLLSKVK